MANALTKTTIWESETTRLVRVSGYKVHKNFPYGRRGRHGGQYVKRSGRTIDAVILHSLAGPFKRGEAAVHGLSNYHSSDPKFDADGNVIGGGRGWPGPGYHIVIPYWPEVADGRLVAYQLWDPAWVTWHASSWNSRSIGVGLGGMHDTRWMPKYSAGQARDPEPTQFEALRSLCLDFLVPTFNLKLSQLKPHAEAGKPTCPGDVVEAWCHHLRGEEVSWLEPERRLWLPASERFEPQPVAPKPSRRSLDTWKERQQALADLGYDIGPSGVDGLFGFHTRSAVTAFQRRRGLIVDGIWGPQTEGAVRSALGELEAKA